MAKRLNKIVNHLQHDDNTIIISKLLDIIENNIIPLTQLGVSKGNKIFGGAILKNNGDLIICGTNNETECPLYHGEVSAIKNFYDAKLNLTFDTKNCIFLSTHEPCSMCLSAITWCGFTKIYYFFDYYATTNNFNIPHDVNILQQIFNTNHYSKSNQYWDSYHIIDIIQNMKNQKIKKQLLQRVTAIIQKYDKLSIKYQNSKQDNVIPLK